MGVARAGLRPRPLPEAAFGSFRLATDKAERASGAGRPLPKPATRASVPTNATGKLPVLVPVASARADRLPRPALRLARFSVAIYSAASSSAIDVAKRPARQQARLGLTIGARGPRPPARSAMTRRPVERLRTVALAAQLSIVTRVVRTALAARVPVAQARAKTCADATARRNADVVPRRLLAVGLSATRRGGRAIASRAVAVAARPPVALTTAAATAASRLAALLAKVPSLAAQDIEAPTEVPPAVVAQLGVSSRLGPAPPEVEPPPTAAKRVLKLSAPRSAEPSSEVAPERAEAAPVARLSTSVGPAGAVPGSAVQGRRRLAVLLVTVHPKRMNVRSGILTRPPIALNHNALKTHSRATTYTIGPTQKSPRRLIVSDVPHKGTDGPHFRRHSRARNRCYTEPASSSAAPRPWACRSHMHANSCRGCSQTCGRDRRSSGQRSARLKFVNFRVGKAPPGKRHGPLQFLTATPTDFKFCTLV